MNGSGSGKDAAVGVGISPEGDVDQRLVAEFGEACRGARDQAERVDRTMRRLADEVFASVSGLSVPRPLGVVPQLALLVYEPAEGTRLDLLPEPSAAAGAREAARWLAAPRQRDRARPPSRRAHEVDNAAV